MARRADDCGIIHHAFPLCRTPMVLGDLIQNGLSLPNFATTVMLLVITMTALVDVTAPPR